MAVSCHPSCLPTCFEMSAAGIRGQTGCCGVALVPELLVVISVCPVPCWEFRCDVLEALSEPLRGEPRGVGYLRKPS